MKIKISKSQLNEIFRFLLVGGLATLVDFGFYELFRWLILKDLNENLAVVISTTIGFLAGNIINYILSILFVFEGAKEDKNAKSLRSFVIFTLIGIVGLVLKSLTQYGCNNLVDLVLPNLNGFWNWFFDTGVWCFATLIALICNYVGRKLFIFKNKNETSD